MKIDINTLGAEKLTTTVLQQIPFAAALALTRTAQQAQRDIIAHFAFDFDRPTDYTMNSTYIKPATKTDLESEVFIKQDASKGTPASKYLAPEIVGGPRGHKRGENALIRAGYMSPGMYFAPGRGQTLDAYGNISGSAMTKIISALGANPYAVPSSKSRARAIAAGKNIDLFVARPGGGRLPLGVWQRLKTKIKPLLIFFDRTPNYRVRIRFYELCQNAFDRTFAKNYNEALIQALKTARVR